MRVFRCLAIALQLLLLTQTTVSQDSSDSAARAILERFLETRESDDNIDLSFTYRQEQFPEMECRLEIADGMRRLEIFRGDDVDREVTVIDKQYAWRFSDGNDLVRTDLETPGRSGWFCFDPRTLGMSHVVHADHELRNMLVEGVQRCELINRKNEGKVKVVDLRVHRGGTVFDYVIEEPTMRLHRKTIKGSSFSTDIVLEYGDTGSTPKDWLPARIIASRKPGGYESEFRNIARATETVSPDRFTVKAIEVPIGTAVVDNVAGRRLGYWDGEDIASTPPFVAKLRKEQLRRDGVRFNLFLFSESRKWDGATKWDWGWIDPEKTKDTPRMKDRAAGMLFKERLEGGQTSSSIGSQRFDEAEHRRRPPASPPANR